MKTIILDPSTFKLTLAETEKPTVGHDEVLIRIIAASINHRDLWILKEKNNRSNPGIIPGSDGAGVVEAVGKGVQGFHPGDEVVINPSLSWGADGRVQGKGYEILGLPTNGTFAEYIAIPAKYVYGKPKHLSFREAAALPLAGLTAYRALMTRGEWAPGNKVLVTGIGGGAALFALNFAVALGAEVYVTSGSPEKISKAVALGASAGANYRESNWAATLKSVAGGFDVIIDSAAGNDFKKLTDLANPGGRIALFGRTAGKISELDPRAIFWKQLSIHGTTMGNDFEFKNMLDLVSSEKILPVIDSEYPAGEINKAFDKMDKGDQFGKIVIDMKFF